jgi:hypothetical protein
MEEEAGRLVDFVEVVVEVVVEEEEEHKAALKK